jgi:hypothetical protein
MVGVVDEGVKHFLLHIYGWRDQTTIDIAICHAEHDGWAPSARYDASASASEQRPAEDREKGEKTEDNWMFSGFFPS